MGSLWGRSSEPIPMFVRSLLTQSPSRIGRRMGISTQKATVNMFGIEKYTDAVLSRDGKRAAVSAFL